MQLSKEFLDNNPALTINFVDAPVQEKLNFFSTLRTLAADDLSLAHSVFKISSCRTILNLSQSNKLKDLTRTQFLGGFSVHKPFDTVHLVNDNCISGTKHWITNLQQAEFVVIQVNHNDTVGLYYVDLLTNSSTFTKDFSFLKTPGLADTCTGDLIFNQCPVEFIFNKQDPCYFLSNNHNTLCFITNYLGGIQGLLSQINHPSTAKFKATYRVLNDQLVDEISSTYNIDCNKDTFWHSRNALYLSSKQLMVDLCSFVIEHCAGNFYNLNSPQGQHFFDCLIYSGHNGPISRSVQQLFTEPQDY